MAAGDTGIFDTFLVDLANKKHNMNATDVWKWAFVDNTITPVAGLAVPTWGVGGTNNMSANAATAATSYTGPVTIANMAFTDVGTNSWKIDFDNPAAVAQDAGGDANISWVIIYNDTATNKECMGWMDMTADGGTTPISLVTGSITWTVAAGGFATITAA